MNGEFVISGLDEKLLFNVLVFGQGYRAQIELKVDPEAGALLVELAPTPTDLPEKCQMSGRVVDENDQPVFGAQVYITGAKTGQRKWWGRVTNVDKVATTDQEGQFLLTADAEFDEWQLTVYAGGFVQQKTDHLPTGNRQQKIQLDPGCTVTGTVLEAGKPVAGLQIGICQKSRSALEWVGESVISTDQNGRFTFANVLPDDTFYVYAKMVGDKKKHTIKTAEFDSVTTGGAKELGEFELKPTFPVAGRIVLTDGGEIPPNQKLTVSREYAWDHQVVSIQPDGSFQIENLPEEPVEFYITVPGYQLSGKRNQFQRKGENKVCKLIAKDIGELTIYLEPDPHPNPEQAAKAMPDKT